MSKGDYYFPLFYKRLLTSTIGWKDDEFGAYVRLLIHQFDNNNHIPNDMEELSLIAPSIKKNWKRLQKKFKENPNGTFYNEVMSDIFNEIQGKKKTNSENGAKGGRPKKPNGYENENRNESDLKPNGFKNKTEVKAIPINNNKESIKEEEKELRSIEECVKISLLDPRWIEANNTNEIELLEFNLVLERRGVYEKNPMDYKEHFSNWKSGGKKVDSVSSQPKSVVI